MRHLRLSCLPVVLLVWVVGCGGSTHEGETPPPHTTFTLDSRIMGEERVINVYVPPGYAEHPERSYPVLYMPDGGVQEDFPHIGLSIDAGIRDGQMRPLILVGIENTQRRRDMTGPTEVETDKEIAPVVGGSESFRNFIADELIPRIDREYRTTDERGIIGESAAGLFIVEFFFERPEVFDTYLALSPSLWWNNDGLVRAAPERLESYAAGPVRLFLTSADETDIAPQTARLAEALEAHAPGTIDWRYEPRPDLRHNNIYRSMAPRIMRTYYAPVKE